MNIGITGATGFIGKKIIDLALRRGHEVIAFTRDPRNSIPGCEIRPFSIDHPPNIRGCEALIHLAGEPVVGLWTPAKKRRIVESRILGTRQVVEAINATNEKPEVFLSSSAIGFYGNRGDEELSETAPGGQGFLAETTQAWEAEAMLAQDVRRITLRTSIVLGNNGGALRTLAPIFKLALGGPLGDGHQWMSWIHLHDLARLALFAIENLQVHGPLNGSAPWPVRNAEFTQILAKILRRPAIFRVPASLLRLALGDFSHELLDSKRVVPSSALDHGFPFEFSELSPALKNLLS
jgi:uncharacterized protein (TIGR01777 family)